MPVSTPLTVQDEELLCNTCRLWKPDEDFDSHKANPGRRYRQSQCKPCSRQRARTQKKNYTEAQKDRVRKQKRADFHKLKDDETFQRQRKNSRLKMRYGIDLSEYEALLEKQNHKCLLCDTTEPDGRGWNVDHNHETGAVRGILCQSCNMRLGHIERNREWTDRALAYLEGDL